MESSDMSANIPADLRNRIMEGERVLYYASGGGCLSGGRSYFLLTDSRAMLSATKSSGCFGFGGSTSNLDIPLEHITSVSTEKSGCISKQGVVSVSSGTATQRVILSPKSAEEASITLQKILKERRKEKK